MTSTSFPRYYLAHETPEGPRYAYPIKGIGLFNREHRPNLDDLLAGVGSTGKPVISVAQPEGAHLAARGSWLISDAPLVSLTRALPGRSVRAGWVKRDAIVEESPVAPELTAAFEAATSYPEPEFVAHYDEHQAPHACWRCRVFGVVYRQNFKPGPDMVEIEGFAGWAPLSGEPDLYPDLEWTVRDSSLLAIYGAHTAHLWPGELTGLRTEVGKRLKAHPSVDKFYDWHGHRSADRHQYFGFSIDVVVPWETPKTKTTYEVPPRKRKAVPVTRPVYAMRVPVQLDVPLGVFAASKAEAVAGFDAAVDAQVARFFPYGNRPVACEHCHGTGQVRGA
jgi:hypothetical protein